MSPKINNIRTITWYALNLLVVVAMVMVIGVGMVEPGRATISQVNSEKIPIDPYVYITLEQEGTARVLVILKEQADLSGANNLTSKIDKGNYVYQQLTDVAARTQGPMRTFLNSKGADYRAYWIQNMFMVTVDINLLQEIAQQPGIERIDFYHQPYPDRIGRDLGADYGNEFGPLPPVTSPIDSAASLGIYGQENGPLPPNSTEAVEWNILRVNADDAWAAGVNGAGAVVGDLDTGVQWDHPALINSYRPQIPGAPTRHDYNWYDGVVGSPIPTDYDGHGTHTMGTIVGDDGGANQIGMAPGAEWIACPGIGSPYVGPFECFQFFLAPTDLNGNNPRPDLAPHVISNSWSSAGTNFHPAIIALYQAGIFFSKSAGNTGSGCNTITNPGQWPEVTAAAAFAQGDTIAGFSSRGPISIGHDLFVKPDIAAPGVNVRSSYPGSSYTSMQGTSMACPHVTGAVALLISANPDLAGRIDILQMILKLSAEPKISTQCQPYIDHPNDVWGWGILNAYDAVVMAQNITLGNMQGIVSDASTTSPIPDVELTFTDVITPWNLFSSSDESGYYLRDLPASTYDVTASHYGYLDETVSGIVVGGGVTVTQDIALTPSPIWSVSGSVVDSMSDGPLAASIIFEETPVTVNTNPTTGLYTADVAQGTWWMDVHSPGHTGQSRQVTVDQDRTEDFILDPIYNYYMHRTADGACGPAFNWMDATGGTARNLGDDANTNVALPTGRSFTFYGTNYNAIYVGSNGIITFGVGDSKWSGPIPDPATPNNGIYAFSTDLNPANGSQGTIYTQYLDDRYFVIEWYQVQHYPNGNPETFEIILDLDTNQVMIQYLTVSNPVDTVSGVENSSGTEATQYAYSDPTLIADNTAVTFYPQFGTPPPSGGAGELLGLVIDADTSAPIAGATVSAVAYTGGALFTYTTDISGTYTAPLCADWYTTTAEAVGYDPVLDVSATVVSGTQTVQDFTLTPICIACSGVDFSWTPITPTVGEVISFTAVASGSLPITYTWDFGDGGIGSGADVTYIFTDTGTYTVTLTVDNCAGTPVVKEYIIEIAPEMWEIFLPMSLRN